MVAESYNASRFDVQESGMSLSGADATCLAVVRGLDA
jgi:hypothetical protein